ncbi:PepF/M3 family oligoendopeptidase [Nitrosopumilaceae archaeon]|nr:M3 family oligoendopeptidase [Nitrosopumilus sp.]CAI9832687.1 PepF/M3 family oligoendopeptidase [Nitrosopumilaceae archaeon]MDA7941467.1 M3 family oligoendopeptidase [Nitrosopumilus sp.]MDA7943392.1 M3 family oligoendopeptidase [Nitrosopumilus sp.]MDA7945544.1 M3 family oligoendopeptidase [Nitrosopumilus sp.]
MSDTRPGRWDITGLAGRPGGKKYEAELAALQKEAASIGRSRSRLEGGGAAAANRMLRRLDRLEADSGRVLSAASLAYAADTQSDSAAALLSRASRIGAGITNMTLFFEVWWKRAGAGRARQVMAGAGELRPYLERERRTARFTLSEDVEKAVNTLGPTGTSALVRLYDRLTGAYTYRVPGTKRRGTREEVSAFVKDASSRRRRAAYGEILGTFSRNEGANGDIYRNVVLAWSDEHMGMRGHASPISVRNSANDLEDGTVRALLRACREGAPVFGRYFAAKARALGSGTLDRRDLYAPLSRKRARIPYGRAVRAVLDSISGFSPRLGAMAGRVFEERRVDAEPRAGKRDGAFCASPAPGITPFILMSYGGTVRDAFTLAHEMGHAVHAVAASSQPALLHDAPLPLAETASTFSELLLAGHLGGQGAAAAAERLDDMYATIQRQAFFTMFEEEAHGMVPGGATTPEISRAYLAGLRRQFGRRVAVPGIFAHEWSSIPHFFHSPFYCYAYSFGNLLALALYGRYEREGPGFAATYEQILGAGGSVKPEDLLAAHGFDAGSVNFWKEGFRQVSSLAREVK